MDRKGLQGGQKWRYKILGAIEGCDIFLACLSKNSVDDKGLLKEGYYQKEIEEALKKEQREAKEYVFLIPVRLDDCKVPDNLTENQWIDFFELDGLKKITKGIISEMDRRGQNAARYEVKNDEQKHKIKYYVSLDLGSETIAAYYEMKTEGGMIELQAHAKELLRSKTTDEPDYLKELDKRVPPRLIVSPRLRTRISLGDNRQPEPLPDPHAELEFLDDKCQKRMLNELDAEGKKQYVYDKLSLFEYFYPPNLALGGAK